MRVVADRTRLAAAPGGQVEVNLEVINNTPVIDGVTARIIGLDTDQVTSHPPLLPLFPEASGKLVLNLGVPDGFPAGRHPLTIEVHSSIPGQRGELVDVELEVEPRPKLSISLTPAVRRSRRRARFHVECSNPGNVPLAATLKAADPDRLLRCEFASDRLQVEPGAVASTTLSVKGKRRLLGSELDKTVIIEAADADHAVTDAINATLRQRPLIARGMLTVLVLLLVIGAWAGAFLLGLTKVFGSDPLTKQAPASFFVSSGATKGLQAAVVSTETLPKKGALPVGVGGSITGTVTARSTEAGVGRIVVQALRPGTDGLVLEGSAATQIDGTYSLLGLLPGPYYLSFSAIGYRTTWYPEVPAATTEDTKAPAGSTEIEASPGGIKKNVNAVVTGLPATITGTVGYDGVLSRPRTTVSAQSLANGPTAKPVKVKTNKSGHYTIAGLKAPGTYELSFNTPGYLSTTLVDQVGGGEPRAEPTVYPSAGVGSISGKVVSHSGNNPLGNATVTTSQDGQQYATATPTQGAVGHFDLTNLPTPGTYVLDISRKGDGSSTEVVNLGPGQQKHTTVPLSSGTGSISGVLTSDHGILSRTTVTVGGAPKAITTTTVPEANGDQTFAVTGLPVPGHYTLTFAANGFGAKTIPVSLVDNHTQGKVSTQLISDIGSLKGKVFKNTGTNQSPVQTELVGATVTITDGTTVDTTTTVAHGVYDVKNLAPGTYSITASDDGQQQQTAVVTIASSTACQDFLLNKPGMEQLSPEQSSCG